MSECGKCVANGSTYSHDGFHYRVGTEARTEAAYFIGSIKGARGRALACHRCGLGSSFGVDVDFLKVFRFLFPVPVVGPSAKDFSHLQRTKFTGGIFLL